MAVSESNTELDIDWKPWAAYILGHHPCTLRLWHELLWGDLMYRGPNVAEQSWQPIATALQEMDDALRLLARNECVKPAVLVELHRVIDRFATIAEELMELPDLIEDVKTAMPGNRELFIMADLSSRVLSASDELHSWHRLGTAIGHRKYILNSGGGKGEQEVDRNRQVQVLTQDLPTRDKAIEAAVVSMRKVPRSIRETQDLFLDLSRLDSDLCARLADRVVPEPILVLNHDTLTFFGETCSLKAFRQGEMACLWILAERAGRSIPRQEIIREGHVKTDEFNLKCQISRVRNQLRKMADAHCQRNGCPRPPGYQSGFIRGQRLKQYSSGDPCGPYALDLDPALVRIQGRRPNWMKGSFERED